MLKQKRVSSDRIMRVVRVSIGTFILAFVTSVSIAQSKAEKEVLKLSSDKFRWLTTGSLDSLRTILDERVRYIHSNGWVQTRDEVLADLQSGKLVYQAIEVKQAEVRLYANTAIVTGTGKFTVQMNGNPLAIDLGYTEVYVKRGKKWWLTSRHANRMNP
jgi:hypothetical protein